MFKVEPLGPGVGLGDRLEDVETWLRQLGDYQFTGMVLSVPAGDGSRENVFLLDRKLLNSNMPPEPVPVCEFNDEQLRAAFSPLLARHLPRLPATDVEHQELRRAFLEQENRRCAA